MRIKLKGIAIVVSDGGISVWAGDVQQRIEVGRNMELRTLFGKMLADDMKMLHISNKRVFEIRSLDEDGYIAH